MKNSSSGRRKFIKTTTFATMGTYLLPCREFTRNDKSKSDMMSGDTGVPFDKLSIVNLSHEHALVRNVPYPGATPVLVDLSQGGKIVAMNAFSGDGTLPAVLEEIQLAGSNGVDIVQLRGNKIIDTGDGWFEVDTSRLNEIIEDTLANNPRAKILLAFGAHPPWSWHAYYGHTTKLQTFDGTRHAMPDASSPIFREAFKRYASGIVAHVESQPYSDAVFGYHISLYQGGEWVMPLGYWGYSDATRSAFQSWLEEIYGTIAALEAAWGTDGIGSFANVTVPVPQELATAHWGPFIDPVLGRKVIDFNKFWQHNNVDLLIDISRTIKEASAREIKPVVGAFYGYSLEKANIVSSGHYGLRKVLDSPWIDFLAAPYSYVYRASAWLNVPDADIGAGMFHGPVDSILANGKLFWTEDDSRTYLTTGDENKSRFLTEIGTIANLRRNHLVNLVRGAGIWHFDIFGAGSFNSQSVMGDLGLQKTINESIMSCKDYVAPYVPEVALILDEESTMYVATVGIDNARPQVGINMFLRDHLARAGVSYGVYLLSDLVAGRVPNCSTYMFAGTCFVTGAERAWINANLKRDGKTLIWFYGSGLYDENGWSLTRMSQLIGMNIAEAPDLSPNGIEPTATLVSAMGGSTSWNTTGLGARPEWYVQNLASGATVLANYVHGSTRRPAIVMENKETWTSIYVGAMSLDALWCLGLVRQASIPQVLNTDATVPVYAGKGIIGIWPTTNMTGTVQLKDVSDVYDLYTGSLLHQGVKNFPVNLTQWEVAGFKITIREGTGIDTEDLLSSLMIYPNPTSGLFTIEMNNQVYGELNISIFTEAGRKMLNIKFTKNTDHFMSQVDLSGQGKGLYLINLMIDKYFANRKIVVE